MGNAGRFSLVLSALALLLSAFAAFQAIAARQDLAQLRAEVALPGATGAELADAVEPLDELDDLDLLASLDAGPPPDAPPPPPPPIEVVSVRIGHNSIGTPEAHVRVRNIGDVEIDAYRLAGRCRDAFGDWVRDRIERDPMWYGRDDNADMEPGETASGVWTLYRLDACNAATPEDVVPTAVHFTDGTRWENLDLAIELRRSATASP